MSHKYKHCHRIDHTPFITVTIVLLLNSLLTVGQRKSNIPSFSGKLGCRRCDLTQEVVVAEQSGLVRGPKKLRKKNRILTNCPHTMHKYVLCIIYNFIFRSSIPPNIVSWLQRVQKVSPLEVRYFPPKKVEVSWRKIRKIRVQTCRGYVLSTSTSSMYFRGPENAVVLQRVWKRSCTDTAWMTRRVIL